MSSVQEVTHRVVDEEMLRSIPTLVEPRYSQSLERGLAILECFTPGQPVWGIAELAAQLGMSRSTTHRHVVTLVRLGHMKQGARRKYGLGMGVVDLGLSAMSGMKLEDQAQPFMADLHKASRFTVVLGVLDGPRVQLVDSLRGTRRGQNLIDLDQISFAWLPVYCTALGKLLLANLPDSEQRNVISELTLTGHTPQTITSKTALRAELQSVREEGLAATDEELVHGMYSIAAPIRSESREVVAAVGIDAHASMIALADLVDALGPHLIATADGVSARLGYRRDDERHSPSVGGYGLAGGGGQ
jgi:IclR family transcriptional regulator, pca regulon regulatory protein